MLSLEHIFMALLSSLNRYVVLLRIIAEGVEIYLHEIQAKLFAMYGVYVTTATICRTLKFVGCKSLQ